MRVILVYFLIHSLLSSEHFTKANVIIPSSSSSSSFNSLSDEIDIEYSNSNNTNNSNDIDEDDHNNSNAIINERIIGGMNVSPYNTPPFIASLQYNGRHACGASIINENWLITAAHCVSSSSTRRTTKVVAGLNNLNDRKNSQIRAIKSILIHELYQANKVGPYDIALIEVSESFNFNEFVKPIKLPSNGKISTGYATLFGWGKISNSNQMNSMPTILQTVTKPIIDFNSCKRILSYGQSSSKLHSSNLCTGPLSGGTSACNGDSGGPLVQKDENNENELIGIVSWGFVPCGRRNSPSVYTRVSAFTEWIENNL